MAFRDNLNQELLIEQKVTDKQISNLEPIYDELELTFKLGDIVDINPIYAHELASTIKDIEFQLQENWNFPLDAKFHTWWNRFKYCTCPKMDNDERFGQDKIINTSYPFHGNMLKDEK
jgi:hypothetical protein